MDRLDLDGKFYCSAASRFEFDMVGLFNDLTSSFNRINFDVISNVNKYETEYIPYTLTRKLISHIKLHFSCY